MTRLFLTSSFKEIREFAKFCRRKIPFKKNVELDEVRDINRATLQGELASQVVQTVETLQFFLWFQRPSDLHVEIKNRRDQEDVNELTHTGEILRRRDGNYCFSCYHCDEYFDLIHEFLAHMNKVLKDGADRDVASNLDVVSYTEFVDVSIPMNGKCELDDDFVMDGGSDEDDREGDVNSIVVNKENSGSATKRKLIIPKTQSQQVNSSSGTYQNHSKFDDENQRMNLMKCCWCSESFDDLGLVRNHLTDDHNKRLSDVYCCENCHLFFKSMKLLGEHILSHHGLGEHEKFQLEMNYQENTKPIQCVVCQLWINGNKAFDAHIKDSHKMYRILQCYVCGIFKKKPSGLLDHLKVHDRFRKYRCYECDNVEPKITNPNDLRSHKCVLCGVWFLNHSTIRNHLADVHGQDQIYDCTICDDFTFKTEWDLKMHGLNVHEVQHCKSMKSLNEHKKNHSATCQTNECQICGSKFRRKDYLVRHIKSHSEASKNFKCYICKKEFQSNGYLKNHIKRHTEKKTYQCEVCGVRFLLPGLLRKHMKEHEGEVWKCTQCPKEFSNKSKLTAHGKTHVTERNFRCELCLKTYKTSKNLRQHKLVHSVERRIKCRICNMTFNQGPEHELHLKTHDSDVTR